MNSKPEDILDKLHEGGLRHLRTLPLPPFAMRLDEQKYKFPSTLQSPGVSLSPHAHQTTMQSQAQDCGSCKR